MSQFHLSEISGLRRNYPFRTTGAFVRFPDKSSGSAIQSINTSAFKGSNERLSHVDTCKDEGHSDASSIKRVTSSSEGDRFVFSMKKGSLSAATKSRI
jgi:hypothetical protein